jgi:hypothetical protein
VWAVRNHTVDHPLRGKEPGRNKSPVNQRTNKTAQTAHARPPVVVYRCQVPSWDAPADVRLGDGQAILGFLRLFRPSARCAPRGVCGYRVFGLAWISLEEMLVPFVRYVAGVVVYEGLRAPEETLLVLGFVLFD